MATAENIWKGVTWERGIRVGGLGGGRQRRCREIGRQTSAWESNMLLKIQSSADMVYHGDSEDYGGNLEFRSAILAPRSAVLASELRCSRPVDGMLFSLQPRAIVPVVTLQTNLSDGKYYQVQ